ncbi:hypothetical protein Lal_00022194 [Lupinus albus]|nr:hypothetical protein Lal_00022194 [Lupinus albus]
MAIIRDIISDEVDIELIGDEEEDDDVEIGSSELHESTLDAIKQFHICNSFDYIVVESRSDRYLHHCKHYGAGCEWRIRESFNVKYGVWKIKKINRTHTCLSTIVSQDHTKLNSSFISNCIINLALVKEIVSRFRYIVTYGKAWIAKQLAISQIYGDCEGLYNDFPRWMNVVQNFASGTIVHYEASRHFVAGIEDPTSFILDRVFWVFKPCIEGFAYCKPILQLPLLLLKEKRRESESDRGAQLLVALRTQLQEWCISTLVLSEFPSSGANGKPSGSSNRNILQPTYLGAFGMANQGFMYEHKHLVSEQCLNHSVSGIRLGLIGNIQQCNAESVYCIRHYVRNFNKEFRDSDIKDKVIQNFLKFKCYELMRPCFERMLRAWLDQIPKAKWAQCYNEGRRYDHMTTNLAECINELTNVIKENQCQFTCQLVRSFSRETEVAGVEAASRSSGRHSKVYTLKLSENSWDCGEFQSLRLSCSHAIATCSTLNLDCGQFISPI